MKKLVVICLVLLLALSLSAIWEVGQPVTDNYSWTDSNGEDHSIHELTAAGKAVVIFWGGYG